MQRVLLFFILTAVTFSSSMRLGFSQSQSEESIKELEKHVLNLVNEYRSTKGLPALAFNENIYIEAKKHSQNMAEGKTPFSHDGFDGRWDRLTKLVGGNSMAENVAMGQETAQEALDSWLSSTGHRENIEGKFNLTAIGIAQGADGDLYFTQIFLLK